MRDEDTFLVENKENIQLIMVHEHSNNSQKRFVTLSMLRDLNPTALYVNDLSSALRTIALIKNEQVLLIVSEAFSLEALIQTRSIRVVQSVFILCQNIHDYGNLSKTYPKLEGIFTQQSELLVRIQQIIPRIQKQIIAFSTFDQKQQSMRNVSKESNAFLWHQVLFYILRQMPADEQAKSEMLEMCANYYRHSKRELQNIEEFRRTERADQAIQWYAIFVSLFFIRRFISLF